MKAKLLYLLCAFGCFCCWSSFYDLTVFTYFRYWVGPLLTEPIVDISADRVNPENEGKIVQCEGELQGLDTLRDPVYKLELKGMKLKRFVETTRTGDSQQGYLTPMEYCSTGQDFRVGAYRLTNLNEDTGVGISRSVCLNEENIPDFLRGRATLHEGDIHIAEEDGSTSVVSFWSECSEPRLRGEFQGRQKGDSIELLRFTTTNHDLKESYYFCRGLMPSLCDVCLRVGFAFSMALLAAFFCFYFLCRLFTKKVPKNVIVIFLLLALQGTLLVFIWEWRRLLPGWTERCGYNLAKAAQCLSFCEQALTICRIGLALTLIYIVIVAFCRRFRSNKLTQRVNM